jgi:hypothetical protein
MSHGAVQYPALRVPDQMMVEEDADQVLICLVKIAFWTSELVQGLVRTSVKWPIYAELKTNLQIALK